MKRIDDWYITENVGGVRTAYAHGSDGFVYMVHGRREGSEKRMDIVRLRIEDEAWSALKKGDGELTLSRLRSVQFEGVVPKMGHALLEAMYQNT